MKLQFTPVSDQNDSLLKYVIIVSRYNNKWIFVQHKQRKTYEIPAGHIEKNELPYEAAKRELFEETGALKFELSDLSDYCVQSEKKEYGRLYFAEIELLGDLPDYEISSIIMTETVPEKLTYPILQPLFFEFAISKIEKTKIK
ncbi:MAG: NUDIX domain-containing protein [Prolixibacteraceae bacterium]|jgi:8-oxo-dGTP diphosphatase|nr:NUDIX domain-containing protein [Prolixibacteraceae bacterium]